MCLFLNHQNLYVGTVSMASGVSPLLEFIAIVPPMQYEEVGCSILKIIPGSK